MVTRDDENGRLGWHDGGFTTYRMLNGKGTRTALAPTRLANDASASTASQSGKSQGEAPPPFVHTAPVSTFGISSTRSLVEPTMSTRDDKKHLG
jgi:hypothetical protein